MAEVLTGHTEKGIKTLELQVEYETHGWQWKADNQYEWKQDK